jgi:membrane protease YdiL (CAAX protease family)
LDLIKGKRNPPWNLKEAFVALLLVYLISNSVGFIVNSMIGSWSPLSQFTLASLVQTAGIVLVVYYFAINKYQGTSKLLGFAQGKTGKYMAAGLGGGMLVLVAVMASSIIVERIFSVPGELQPFAQLVIESKGLPQLLLLFFLGVVLAPFGEELYFRGFLYPAIRARLGVPLAIFISAVVFSLLHFDLLRFIPLAVGGATLAWLYEKTDSLYVPIVAHGFWNFIMLLILIIFK